MNNGSNVNRTGVHSENVATKIWQERITEAKKLGHFSDEDKSKVGNWKSCAIGEKYDLMPFGRFKARRIVEKQLAGTPATDLGLEFYFYVMEDNVSEAENILTQISKLPPKPIPIPEDDDGDYEAEDDEFEEVEEDEGE